MGKSLDQSKESSKSRQSSAKPSVQQQQEEKQQQRAPRTTSSTPAALTEKEGKVGKLQKVVDSHSRFEKSSAPSN